MYGELPQDIGQLVLWTYLDPVFPCTCIFVQTVQNNEKAHSQLSIRSLLQGYFQMVAEKQQVAAPVNLKPLLP